MAALSPSATAFASLESSQLNNHFGLNGLKQYLAFLARTDMFDRGEVVDIHSFLHAL